MYPAIFPIAPPGGQSYNDRGDPAAVDYTEATLSLDNAWHTLDLSAIVGAIACLVHLRLYVFHASIAYFFVRKNGNTNEFNAGQLTNPANAFDSDDLFVQSDDDGKIEYKGSAGITSLDVTVAGWMA